MTEIFFHFFATIALVSLSASQVETWNVMAIIAFAGLIIDGVRHLLSPEYKTTPQIMYEEYKNRKTRTVGYKKSLRFWLSAQNVIAFTWICYYTIFAAIMTPNEKNGVPYYFAWFAPIERLYSEISEIDRRAINQLIQHGYTNRANIVSFFYTMNAPFFLLYAGMTFSGYAFITTFQQLDYYLDHGKPNATKKLALSTAAILFAFSIFSEFFVSNLFHITWNTKFMGYSFYLAKSNKGLLEYGLGQMATAGAMFHSYRMILVAKCLKYR
jgi:hypothetical protein